MLLILMTLFYLVGFDVPTKQKQRKNWLLCSVIYESPRSNRSCRWRLRNRSTFL